MPHPDQNFVGAENSETGNIRIIKTRVSGLHAHTLEVPALMTNDGSWVQGPVRDLFRIFDVTTDKMQTLMGTYQRDFLHDAYFALWQLSNAYCKRKKTRRRSKIGGKKVYL